MTLKSPEFIYIGNFQRSDRGSLDDLRLGVKDLFDVAGIPTGAGNPDWLATHPIPEATAPCVAALLTAGASLVGKTLTDELAYSLEGVNKHYGTPVNPQAPNRLPGGSSSGSAVGVANGSIDIGLGTDTGGSIRVPASYNGIYGFRPSHGVISCEGVVPLSPRFDTVGWLTRDLATIKRVGKVLLPSGFDLSLSHLIVGEIEGLESWTEQIQPLLEAIQDCFIIIQKIKISADLLDNASTAFRILQGREIWRVHGKWLEQNQPDLAPEISDRFTWCKSLTAEQEQQAEDAAREFINFWHTEIIAEGDRVLMIPTTPGAAPLLNTPAAELARYRSRLMGMTAPAGLTRAPQISLPYLTDEQAPWGISLIARSGCDLALLDCAIKLDEIRLM